MNGVTSLWTKTKEFRLRRDHMLTATLSLNYGAEIFDEIEFVSDMEGVRFGKHLGWSRVIHCCTNILDGMPTKGIDHVWALGKLYAIRIQEEPFCHFDWDVLLRKRLPGKILTADIFAQSIDYPYYYASDDIAKGLVIAGLPPGGIAYNCGIVGGNDIDALSRYASEALVLADRFAGLKINGTSASMVIEQYHLGEFARRSKIRVQTLLSLKPTDEEVKRAGYTHLHGESKRNPKYVNRVEVALKRDFPEAYDRFNFGWQQLCLQYRVQE